MSLRTGLLIGLIALAIAGGVYLVTSDGGGTSAATLDQDRGETPGAVVEKDAPRLEADAEIAIDTPTGTERAVAAPVEETTSELAASSNEDEELDRSSVTILSGYVRDERGMPVAEAAILASRSSLELMAADSFGGMMGMMEQELGTRFVETTTDQNGYFELVDIPPGQPGLRISAAGFVPQVKTDVLIAAREHQELATPIVLDASAVITGIVLDPNGTPVEGADVTTHKKNAGMMGAARMFSSQAAGVKTNADGTFRLDMLKLEELEVLVKHPEYSDGTADADTREGGTIELELRLEKGLSIQGRVKGLVGDAHEALHIMAIPADFNPMQNLSVRNAKVAADGGFEIWGLAEGTRWNLVGREGGDGEETMQSVSMMFMGMEGGLVTDRVEAVTGARDVELTYRPSATITFQVVDAGTGKPVTRLEVQSGQRSWFGGRTEAVDYPGGHVRLEGQRPSPDDQQVQISIDAIGYQSSMETVSIEGQAEVDAGIVKLEPAVVAKFLVTDAVTQLPVEGVLVTVSRSSSHQHDHGSSGGMTISASSMSAPSEASESTDAEGIARVETSLEGKVRVTARSDDHGPFELDEVSLLGADVTPIQIELRKGANVRVVARDINGLALPARKIEHRSPGGRSGFNPFDSTDQVTDMNGVSSFDNLEPGTHGFRIAKLESSTGEPNFMMMMMAMERGEEDEESWTTVEVGRSGTEELVLVELPTGSLTGRITEAGKALRRATLTLRKVDAEDEEVDEDMDATEAVFREMGKDMAGQGAPSAKTERDGSYSFESVEVGDYVLEIDYRKRAMRAEYEITIVAGDQAQDFDLDLAILSGKVVDAEGKGVKGALVSVVPYVEPTVDPSEESGPNTELARELMGELFGVEGKVRTFKTKSSGAFELRGVTPDVRLIVQVDGSEVGYQNARSEPITLRSNEERDDIELVVQQGGSLDVVVLEQDGEAPEFVLVRLIRVDAPMEPMNEIAPGGIRTVTGLTPGTYRVIADDNPDEEALFGDGDPEEIGKVETTVEVVGGETLKVELRLPE